MNEKEYTDTNLMKVMDRVIKEILAKKFKKQDAFKRSIEEKLTSWEKRLERMQSNNYPLILQKSCIEIILKFKMEKILKDHCKL